jgi:hypothetical protein
VPSTSLERDRIARLVEAAGERLTGDWILIGGALAALWFSPGRVTEDIDMVSMASDPQHRWQLLDFAIEQGLPVEAVNSAADFFLRRIPGWQDELELLHQGPGARIFRPTPTLFLLLKSPRAGEADLADCLALLDLAKREGLTIDRARVLAHLDTLPEPESDAARARRERLRAVVGAG